MSNGWLPDGARLFERPGLNRVFFEHRGWQCQAYMYERDGAGKWVAHGFREPYLKHREFARTTGRTYAIKKLIRIIDRLEDGLIRKAKRDQNMTN